MKSSKNNSIQFYKDNPDKDLMVPPILESWNIEDLDDILPTHRVFSTYEFEASEGFIDSIDQISGLSGY